MSESIPESFSQPTPEETHARLAALKECSQENLKEAIANMSEEDLFNPTAYMHAVLYAATKNDIECEYPSDADRREAINKASGLAVDLSTMMQVTRDHFEQ